MESRIDRGRYELLNEYKFIDNGYSELNLKYPGLYSLRGKVVEGKIGEIYVHLPGRFLRRCTDLKFLSKEFQKAGAKVIFLNCQIDDSPGPELLLDVQRIAAEYLHQEMKE
ncbi:recombinase family protein, partial [Wolbachia endosymbiont of Wuchereria bancrofti]|uniref:recombinase family protein n=1 Tax=Wolbachia endosymbiont of Wuchereria bancrofti TaxID=96496 RepID=UPI000B6603E8